MIRLQTSCHTIFFKKPKLCIWRQKVSVYKMIICDKAGNVVGKSACTYGPFPCQRLCLLVTQRWVLVTRQRGNWFCVHDHFLMFCLFVFSELGSNPLNSAGIDEGAFADLKRVSYIRIADTNITEIPKGTAVISVWTNRSFIWLHYSHAPSRQSASYAKMNSILFIIQL